MRDAPNLAVSTTVCALALLGRHDEAVCLVGTWSVVDCVLVWWDPPRRGVAFRDSLLVHHALVCLGCAMHTLAAPAPMDWLHAILCLEFSTPFLCLHNVCHTRLTSRLRLVAWVVFRTLGSARLLYVIARDMDDHVTLSYAPYCVAVVTLTLSWTCRNTPNVSWLPSLLVPYLAHRRGVPLAQWIGWAPQLWVSYRFYNCADRDVVAWRRLDHALLLVNVLCLLHDWHVVAAAALATTLVVAAPRALLSPLVNTVCLGTILSYPSVEQVACLGVLIAYVLLVGPRQLTFGHRILWHTVGTSVFLRALDGHTRPP